MNIEAEVKRDMHNHYLILKTDENNMDHSYRLKMLQNNKINGLLPLEVRVIDNLNMYYYDITSKQPLSNIFGRGYLKNKQIKEVMIGILDAIKPSNEYLLDENDFILEPEYIYLNFTNNEVSLCHVVGYKKNIKKQLSEFIEFLMNKVDYIDESAVILTYGLYKLSSEDRCTFEELYKHLEKSEKREDNIEEKKETEQHIQIERKQEERKVTIQKAETECNTNNQEEHEKIPLMDEKVESEEEVTIISKKSILFILLSIFAILTIILIALKLEFIYNSKHKLDVTKVFGLFIVIGSLEGYLLNKILAKEHRTTKIIHKIEYINPGKMYYDKNNESHHLFKNSKPHSNYQNEGVELKMNESDEIIHNTSINSTPSDINRKNNLIVNVLDSSLINEEQKDIWSNQTTLLSDLSEPTDFKLFALEPEKYTDIDLIEFPFFIGKLKTNVNFAIENNTISRFHAKIEKEKDQFYITDLDSTNGTYVNDMKLETREKKEIFFNDRIRFADIRYRFQRCE